MIVHHCQKGHVSIEQNGTKQLITKEHVPKNYSLSSKNQAKIHKRCMQEMRQSKC